VEHLPGVLGVVPGARVHLHPADRVGDKDAVVQNPAIVVAVTAWAGMAVPGVVFLPGRSLLAHLPWVPKMAVRVFTWVSLEAIVALTCINAR